MMSVDMVVVQRYFDKEQTGFYAAAGMIGRALIFFVGPMVAVMFPKIVKSHAEQKPTDVLRFTLLLTAGLCTVAIALGILVPDLPLRMVYDDSFLKAAPLVPWFIAAMAPLALAAVLVNNILARCKSKNVYLLLGVPVIYAGLLCYAGPQIAEQTSDSFNVDAHISMVGLIGMGNLCFLASTVILTWVVNREAKLLLAQATENPPPDEAEAR
jgi:O-antigen/teichoic acid export membrane protein